MNELKPSDDVEGVLADNRDGLIYGATFEFVSGSCPELEARIMATPPDTDITITRCKIKGAPKFHVEWLIDQCIAERDSRV